MLTALASVWHLIAGGIVLILPGLSWQAWFPERDEDFASRLAKIVGLSISLTAVLALAAYLASWRLSAVAAASLYGLCGLLALLGWLWNATRQIRDPNNDPVIHEERRSQPRAYPFLVLAGFGLLLAWRFFQVRELVLPAWVDPVHHTLIVRNILERGGVPSSLEPYMPVPFYYHFAFHVIAAAFSMWSGLQPAWAVLFLGQLLNAAVVLSVYRLSEVFWGDWRRAGLAAVLAGFVTQMPAYYATWGRYTLLTGLILLPLAMAEVVEILREGVSPQRIARLTLFIVGLILAHYFAAILLAVFLFVMSAEQLLSAYLTGTPLVKGRWIGLASGTMAGVLLAAPWIYRIWRNAGTGVYVELISPTQELDTVYFPEYLSYLWRMVGPNHNRALFFLAILGLVITLWSKKARAIGWWALALVGMSLPWGIHLRPFRPDHAVIVLFLPATLLVAQLIFFSIEKVPGSWPRVVPIGGGGILLLGLVGWGLWVTRTIINPDTVIASQADVEAIQWITTHTQADARFLINTTYWQAGAYRGVDGGYWIMPLSGRQTSLPPGIYPAGSRAYIKEVNALAKPTSQLTSCEDNFWELVRKADITHIYLVEGVGSLQPTGLKGCAGIQQVYNRKGVFIYQVERKENSAPYS